MDLSRRALLAAAGASGLLGLPLAARAGTSGPRHLVVLYAEGGWDTSFCFDPKPGSAWVDGPETDEVADDPDDRNEIRTWGELAILTNASRRPAVEAFFDRWWSRAAVVNGLAVGSIAHEACRTRLFTGTTSAAQPDVTAITGYARGGDPPLGSVDLSNIGIPGSLAASTARVGRSSQLEALIDPSVHFTPPSHADYTLPIFRPADGDEAAVRAFLEAREATLRDRYGGAPPNDAALDALLESLDRRTRLLARAGPLADGLRLGEVPVLATQIDLAVSLLQGGICNAVLMRHTGFDWDTHYDNTDQHEGWEQLFTELDRLLASLDAAGLLDSTLIAVVSEMSRTPRLNATGGKDHWPYTSALLLGAGVAGGRTVGATDDYVEGLPVDLDSGARWDGGTVPRYDHLVAGLLEAMGVDPAAWVPSAAPLRGPFTE